MEFLKDGVLYNTETSTKIGGPVEAWDPAWYRATLYLSKNKRYYLFIMRKDNDEPLHPTNVKVLTNDEAFCWATKHLPVDTVKKHFSDMISEG